MRIEFLESGAPECPLMRLFDLSADDVEDLVDVFDRLATGATEYSDLTTLPWIASEADCKLLLRRGRKDIGTTRAATPNAFVCELTREGWAIARELAEPLREPKPGMFQWLDE